MIYALNDQSIIRYLTLFLRRGRIVKCPVLNFFLLVVLFFSTPSLLVAEKPNLQKEQFERFEESMKSVRFEGYFTVDGADRPPSKEIYEISSVQKFGEEDLWIFTARIRYGKKDVTLPMPLPVKWIGEIPVITMNNFSIPGLGTFSAHVVIDGKKYAGTWSHGKVGGHLYGKIEKM